MKKYIAVAVLLLLISVNVIPSTSTIVEKKSIILTFNEGSLSGFVNDTSMNSIEGAVCQVIQLTRRLESFLCFPTGCRS